MCERYVLPDRASAEREFAPARVWWTFSQRFNVAPQQYVPAVRWHDDESEAVMLHWGFLPSDDKLAGGGSPPACIDLEEIETAPAFRAPWLESRRCILPVTGFYVWHMTPAKYRQPYFVKLLPRSVFGLAAIWDRREGADDDVIESCAIVRVPANELLSDLSNRPHPRMPAILKRKNYQAWLRGTPVEAKAALQPYRARWMQAHPVSPRINSLVPDDPLLTADVSSR